MTRGTWDFFVSYTNRGDDPRWATWVASALERHGNTTVIQAWDMQPGGNFVVDMHEFIDAADRMIMILSPDYLHPDREMVLAEWSAMFHRDPAGRGRKLVGVMVRDCRPTGLLANIVHIRLMGLDAAAAETALVHGLGIGGPTARTPPPFPG